MELALSKTSPVTVALCCLTLAVLRAAEPPAPGEVVRTAAVRADDRPIAPALHVDPPAVVPSPSAAQPPVEPRHLRGVLSRYCVDCHDSETLEGGLDLASLPFNVDDSLNAARWERVHDRMRNLEMPPADADQPGLMVRDSLLRGLDAALHAASRARQQRDGRARARRLNRDEYQYTLRDLLGVEADYRSRLPEDGTAYGFDKVGSALSLSAEHMDAYMAVSHAALEEFFRGAGPAPEQRKTMYPQRLDVKHYSQDFINRFGPLYGDLPDAIVRFGDFLDDIFGDGGAFLPKEPGYYRFTMRARTWQSDKPVKARLRTMQVGVSELEAKHLVGFFEFPPEGAEVTRTAYLTPTQKARLSPYGICQPQIEHTAILRPQTFATYPGPGLAIEWVEIEGPLYDVWPPVSFQQICGDVDWTTAGAAEAEAILRRFLPRACRRPAMEEEVRQALEVYARAAEHGGFREGLRVAMQSILCSPSFLYLHAPAGPLDDFALASRLSYWLWSSMPDERLRALAESGELRRPERLSSEVQRLLADAKSANFVESFTGQWLDLRRLNATTPDPKLYPEYDKLLEWSMAAETRRFFEEILHENLSIRNFLDSDFAMLNDRLAEHYGVPGVNGVELRRVELPEGTLRGGVLTQAAVLKVTADGTSTSPVRRGVWVCERLLGMEVPPPPAGVPAVEPDIRGARTIREQLAQHRHQAACAACHARLDPAGFALERFDVIGGERSEYRAIVSAQSPSRLIVAPMSFSPHTLQPYTMRVGIGPPVDASGTWETGESFADFADFRRQLLAREEDFARCLTTKLIVYATGAGPQYADRAAIADLVERLRSDGEIGLMTLIQAIASSPLVLEQ